MRALLLIPLRLTILTKLPSFTGGGRQNVFCAVSNIAELQAREGNAPVNSCVCKPLCEVKSRQIQRTLTLWDILAGYAPVKPSLTRDTAQCMAMRVKYGSCSLSLKNLQGIKYNSEDG